MNYMNLKVDICLDSAAQMCQHQVVSMLNISGLMKHDVLGFSSGDGYHKDPFTESASEDFPSCHFYLSTFLKQTMRRISWKPEMHAYFCTGYKQVKNLPPKGLKSMDLTICKTCKTLVIDSLSDSWVYLTSSMAGSITDGTNPENAWTLTSASNRKASKNWNQSLAERIICAWENGLMHDSSHLPVLTWSPALAEVDQESIIQMWPLMITWPKDMDEEEAEDLVKSQGCAIAM